MSEITPKQATRIMAKYRDIHVQWAEHFERNPEIEKEKVATGEWDTAKKHRELAREYDQVISLINKLSGGTTT